MNTAYMAYTSLQGHSKCGHPHAARGTFTVLSIQHMGTEPMSYVQVGSNAWRETSTEHSWGRGRSGNTCEKSKEKTKKKGYT